MHNKPIDLIAGGKNVKADETVDTRGTTCPVPVMLTKSKLESVDSGTVLEVIVDYPAGKDNVQRVAKEAGHEVLDVIEEAGEFKIYIRKE